MTLVLFVRRGTGPAPSTICCSETAAISPARLRLVSTRVASVQPRVIPSWQASLLLGAGDLPKWTFRPPAAAGEIRGFRCFADFRYWGMGADLPPVSEGRRSKFQLRLLLAAFHLHSLLRAQVLPTGVALPRRPLAMQDVQRKQLGSFMANTFQSPKERRGCARTAHCKTLRRFYGSKHSPRFRAGISSIAVNWETHSKPFRCALWTAVRWMFVSCGPMWSLLQYGGSPGCNRLRPSAS